MFAKRNRLLVLFVLLLLGGCMDMPTFPMTNPGGGGTAVAGASDSVDTQPPVLTSVIR